MKIPFGISGFLASSRVRPRILLHGNLVHTHAAGSWTASAYSREGLNEILAENPSSLLFLAAPYVHSYVHETIHLPARELEKADRQLLDFGHHPPPHQVSVSALRLNDKKALTIHSHLTSTGSELLQNLEQKPTPAWYPAVLSLIANFQDRSKTLPETAAYLRVFLSQEALQFETHDGKFRCFHLNYVQSGRTHEEQQRTAELILAGEGGRQAFPKLVFDADNLRNTDHLTHAPEALLVPPPRNRDIKSVSRTRKKRRLSIHLLLKPNTVFGLAALIIILWAAALKLHVATMNRERAKKQQLVAELQEKSIRISQVADMERRYFRISAIGTTVGQMQVHPVQILQNLKPLLPKGVWLQRVAVSHHRMVLSLLDSGEIEVSQLIDRLGTQFGKTSLTQNEGLILANAPVRRYQIEITNLLPQK